MDDLHPHWQTTEDEQPVEIRIAEKRSVPKELPRIQSAKRSPAAFFGIAVIVAIGFFAFGGMDLLPAQLSSDTIIIISDAGVSPNEVNVQPGQRVTWTNTSTIPQILTSKTLKDSDGKLFITPAVFPNSEVSFDIPASTPNGTYDFESNTSPTITGSIIVGPESISATSVASTASFAPTPSSTVFVPPSSAPVSVVSSAVPAPVVQQASSVAADTSVTGIPTNPYTVANAFAGTVTKDIAPAPATVTTHRPVQQPESGTGLWLTVIAGVLALIVVMRKASLRA